MQQLDMPVSNKDYLGWASGSSGAGRPSMGSHHLMPLRQPRRGVAVRGCDGFEGSGSEGCGVAEGGFTDASSMIAERTSSRFAAQSPTEQRLKVHEPLQTATVEVCVQDSPQDRVPDVGPAGRRLLGLLRRGNACQG
mmetsp:Transcript_19131/g.43490  ORF Transcript_19131/g.43490 Transcript_19131/m.43490 type:complete len:137 (-) Transcript_19131:25-435(-)